MVEMRVRRAVEYVDVDLLQDEVGDEHLNR
jgi:hypothetical protein